MAFIAGIIEAVLKAVIIIAAAVAGGIFGKKMRDKKTAKAASDNE